MRIRSAVVASAVASLFLAGTHGAARADDAAMGAKEKCEGVNSCKGQNGCSGQGFREMSQTECATAKAKLKDKKG